MIRKGRRTRIVAEQESLPFPSHDLLDGGSLFLDLDGTLLDLADRPDLVRADAGLRRLLHDLHARLEDRLAIVSGRSLDQIDTILGEVAARLALSGSHGSEHRWPGGIVRPERPAALDHAAKRVHPFVAAHPGMLIEEKSLGVAMHYRMNPEAGGAAVMLADAVARDLGLIVQRGKMMVELRPPGADKAGAVRFHMARAPMACTRPVFAGDDLTDEPAFVAARAMGGHGILVGGPRDTAADHAMATPSDLRAWLAHVAR